MKAIEGNFPFEYLSEVAEIESWRKELYRPIYHMHKWWARRLGSVFRAVILGAWVDDETSNIMDLLYEPVDLDGFVVFDPFMGSGVTVGEAHKLGCTAIGRDINPVAYRLAKIALSKISHRRLLNQFNLLRERVAPELLELYQSPDRNGHLCDVLYYFWVKVLPCPSCKNPVDLFPTYIFARHAYPKKHPDVQIICPGCNHIFPGVYNGTSVQCPACNLAFNPQLGNAHRTEVSCRHCGESFSMAKIAGAQGCPPEHRLYAKLILSGERKEYLKITGDDLELYRRAQTRLKELNPPLPHVRIEPGYNTRQILNYGYHYWDQLFNDRQLLALSILAGGIKDLPACPERDVLMLLFSGVLEFNNMFASYKGEGTGAVRHMFSHHILKPERMPLEANVWGTAKSSGSFLNLFHSRILRAIKYKETPFEVSVHKTAPRKRGEKIFGLSPPIGADITSAYPGHGLSRKAIYLSCGNSARTDLPDKSVDVIITDPPFFDNVHYAELADFFYVWQQLYFNEPSFLTDQTTRHSAEVQDVDLNAFAQKLAHVFAECYRVLRADGLLIFSYHHSRNDGWLSVARAVLSSNFSLIQAQPVKAEMSVATPKSQASSPIDLDILLICKKQECDDRSYLNSHTAFEKARAIASSKIERFNRLGRKLSLNDVKVVLYSQLLVELSPGRSQIQFSSDFEDIVSNAQQDIDILWERQVENEVEHDEPHFQLALFKSELGSIVSERKTHIHV